MTQTRTIEVKRRRTAMPGEILVWWRQTAEQAAREGPLPVLMYRADQADWRAVWPLANFMVDERTDCWRGADRAADTTVLTWAAVVRHIDVHTFMKGGK